METMKPALAAVPRATHGGRNGGGMAQERCWLHGGAPFAPRASQQLLFAGYGVDWAGLIENTPNEFARHLNNMMFLVPRALQPDENRYAIKMLECLSRECPSALALEAMKELKAQGVNRRFVHANAANGVNRDLGAIVAYWWAISRHCCASA